MKISTLKDLIRQKNKLKLVLVSILLLFQMQSCKEKADSKSDESMFTNGKGNIGINGGTVTVQDSISPIYGATVIIPEGALKETQAIELTYTDETFTAVDAKTIVVSFKPEGLKFEKPVIIGLPWGSNQYTNDGIKAYHLMPENGIINELKTHEVDLKKGLIYAYTDHFSLFYAKRAEVTTELQVVRIGSWPGAIFELKTSLRDISPSQKHSPFSNAAQIIENKAGQTDCFLRVDFYLDRKGRLGIGRRVAMQSFYIRYSKIPGTSSYRFWVDKSKKFHHNAPVETEEIFHSSVNSLDDLLSVWMTGKPFLAIFDESTIVEPDFSFSPNDEYKIFGSWGVVKNYNAYLGPFIWTWRYSISSDWFKLSQLQGFTGDSNQNQIIDHYELPAGTTPIANFAANLTTGPAPLRVSFTDLSTNSPTSWHWDFGDGNTSNLKNPTHTYHNIGNYAVQLTVTNQYGNDTKIRSNMIQATGNGGPCPGTPVFSYGGQIYNTVQIGNQCWMKENLNAQLHNSPCYEANPSNCGEYGRLYFWNTAKNACPPGWRLPNNNDWCTLAKFFDSSVDCDAFGFSGTDAGYKMKSRSGWSFNGNGSDVYNFNGLPGGVRNSDGSYFGLGLVGKWWSSSESEYVGTAAWVFHLDVGNNLIGRTFYEKTNSFSVRCIKNR